MARYNRFEKFDVRNLGVGEGEKMITYEERNYSREFGRRRKKELERVKEEAVRKKKKKIQEENVEGEEIKMQKKWVEDM